MNPKSKKITLDHATESSLPTVTLSHVRPLFSSAQGFAKALMFQGKKLLGSYGDKWFLNENSEIKDDQRIADLEKVWFCGFLDHLVRQ